MEDQKIQEPIVFVGAAQAKTWGNGSERLGINCGEAGMLKVWSQTENGGIGKPIHQLYCGYVRITIEQLTEDQAKEEFTKLGGTWNE